MNENKYQAYLKKRIGIFLPDCIILKNDPDMIQGIPDLIILYDNKWAALEVKKSKKASHRPNQDYYVKLMNEMGFAAFIYPENEEEVLDNVKKYFGVYEPANRTCVRPGLKAEHRRGKTLSSSKSKRR